jgi:hypothetical protein
MLQHNSDQSIIQDMGTNTVDQRGLIYTENKVVFTRCVCNPFFHEFQVIPSANGFRLVCLTATLFTTDSQRQQTRGLTLSDILLTLAGGEELAMI